MNTNRDRLIGHTRGHVRHTSASRDIMKHEHAQHHNDSRSLRVDCMPIVDTCARCSVSPSVVHTRDGCSHTLVMPAMRLRVLPTVVVQANLDHVMTHGMVCVLCHDVCCLVSLQVGANSVLSVRMQTGSWMMVCYCRTVVVRMLLSVCWVVHDWVSHSMVHRLQAS